MIDQAKRYRQIGEVLARHGLGYVAGVTGLGRWLPFHHGMLGHERRDDPYTTPEHLRLALEELGPTFIKLGQLLSTRSDLLPANYLVELSKLQDGAPPVAAAVIRELIEHELGAPVDELFAAFESEPLASASIGQAHAAALHDGTPVVVKVRRPDVIAAIDTDLEILHNLAHQASRHWDAAADYNLTGLVAEFARTLRGELDYLQEGRNAERFAHNFDNNADVHIPQVFWSTTTSRVLTLERMAGINVNDLDALDRAGIDREALAQRSADVAATMVFDDGFFHADPHPGNLFIEPGGRIGLIDFGMVGEVNDTLHEQLGDLLGALIGASAERLGEVLRELSVVKRPVDHDQLSTDLTEFMSLYQGRPIGEVAIGPLITRLLALLRTYHLQLPRDVPLLLKFVLMVEGIGVRLDPQFNLGQLLKPYAQRLALRRFSPEALAKLLTRSGHDTAELVVELPTLLHRLLKRADANGIEVHLRTADLDLTLTRLERIGNRLVAGLIAAALIKAIGELTEGDPKRWSRWEGPLMRIGLSATTAIAAYLTWTTRRTRRS